MRKNQTRYYAKNRVYYQEYNKSYIKEYKVTNKVHISECRRSWLKTPKGKLYRKLHRHNRRLAESGLTKEVVQRVYEENVKKYGTLMCELCLNSVVFGEDALEHFIPLSRGGTNRRDNLGVAHGNNSVEKCNTRKGNKTLEEWFCKRKER